MSYEIRLDNIEAELKECLERVDHLENKFSKAEDIANDMVADIRADFRSRTYKLFKALEEIFYIVKSTDKVSPNRIKRIESIFKKIKDEL